MAQEYDRAEARQAFRQLQGVLKFAKDAENAIGAAEAAVGTKHEAEAALVPLRQAKEELTSAVTLLRSNRAILDAEYKATLKKYTAAHAANLKRIQKETVVAVADAKREVEEQESARQDVIIRLTERIPVIEAEVTALETERDSIKMEIAALLAKHGG